ncbi:MAG: NAD-dependent epimerase/dehydratase family protein [Acidimicrobiales bacterium]
MPNSVLVTGGAGFIGGHLVSRLLEEGHRVRVLDSLLPQVHGDRGTPPDYLAADAELVVGDMRDAEAVAKALVGIDQVVHLCARVGVGQSMYEIADYVGVNATGTGVLLQALLEHPVERLVVASSMSVYGEGLYLDGDGLPRAAVRRREHLEAGRWEPRGPSGQALTPVPTPETKPPALSSVYALTKYDQERLCLLFGEAYQVPTVALRFFNVYGPYQALSNPYTGVLAIFASRLLNGRSPMIFEDGEQRRDFVSVHDVARACALALSVDAAAAQVVNIGSGCSVSVNEIAARLGRILGEESLAPEVTGRFRVGDIRHCFADVSMAAEVLGYRPEVDLDQGMTELATWLEGQVAVDQVDAATSELRARGLTV